MSKKNKNMNSAEEQEKTVNDAEEILKDATENNTNEPVEDVKEESAPLSEEEETFKLQLQRLQAEFLNYKKRTEKEKFELSAFVKAEFTKRFLPVFDDISRLNENVNADENTLKDALKLVSSKLDKFFEDEKITSVAAVGDEFDPNFHEALMQLPVEKDEDDDKIISVFEQGFKINDRIIRFAKVQVGKKN
jgi:molecular chaperone GrpE